MKKYLLVLLCISISFVSAQQIDKMNIHKLDIKEFPLITIYYTLTDSSGNYLPSPWPEDFEIREDVSKENVWGFDEEHAPASIVLILDSSGSMEGSMDGVLSSAALLINRMDRYDEAEIIDFDSRVKVIHEFSDDRESLSSALDKVKVGGSTALYDSIVKGIGDVRLRKGMKAIVLLTDGKDENAQGQPQSKTTLEEAEELLQQADIALYAIGLGSGIDKTVLESLTGLSGGKAYYAAETDAVDNIYQDIISYLHALHRINYITAKGMHDGSRRRIEVTVERVKAETSYAAPEKKYWSYCLKPFNGESGYNVLGLAITADGSYIAEPQYRAILTKEGFRAFVDWRWFDSFRGTLTQKYYLARGSYGWHGTIYSFNGKELEEIESLGIISSAPSNIHKDWQWGYVGLSRNGKYVLAVTGDSDEYPFTFLLMDREKKEVLWEKGFFKGEFAEPRCIKVAGNGTSFITQDFNLFVLDREGKMLYKRIWEKTGKRYFSLAVSGDGSRYIAFIEGWEKPWNYKVEVYDRSGKVLWEAEAEMDDRSFTVDISCNGMYCGVCDAGGVRIFDRDGKILFKDYQSGPDQLWGTGLAIADNGSFVYGLANRIYYRMIEAQ